MTPYLAFLLALAASKLLTFDPSFDFSEGSWFVMYFAPWCSHCKAAQLSFIQVASLTTTRLTLVDCELYKDFCISAGVKKFPTFKYYSDDFNYDYEFGRTANELHQFLGKVNSPPYMNVTSAKSIPSHDTAFVLHYKPSDYKIFRSFVQVAWENWATLAYYITIRDNSTYIEVQGKDSAYHYRLKDLTIRDIQEFVQLHQMPTLVELDANNFHNVISRTKEMTLVLLAFDKSQDSKKAMESFELAAVFLRNSLEKTFQACTLNFELNSVQLEPYAITSAPALIKIKNESAQKYFAKTSENLDLTGILEFIEKAEFSELNSSLWTSFKDLAWRTATFQVISDNKFVVSIVVAILAVSMILGHFLLEEDKAKTE